MCRVSRESVPHVRRNPKRVLYSGDEVKRYKLTWAPTMAVIATVEARDAMAARRKAPKPYRKFLGEIIAEELT